MSDKLPYLDRVAAFYDLAQTTTSENPEWHVYSMTDGTPDRVLEFFPDLKLPAVVFCTEKMEFGSNPPIDFRFSILICVDATDPAAAEKTAQYRKKVGELVLAQAVANPALRLESSGKIELDPLICTEQMRFSLTGY